MSIEEKKLRVSDLTMPCVNCTEDGGPLKTAAVPVPTLPMPDQEELDSKFSELVVSPLSTECLKNLYL